MICLAAGALIAAGAGAATAQETVNVDGVEATRVVIAPPDSPVAQIIKDKLSADYYGANPSSRAYADAQKLYYFYGARHFDPIWLSKNPDGSEGFSPSALKLIDVFKDATSEGFNPADYLTPNLDVTAAGTDPQKLADLETAFSASAIRYAHDAYLGRIAPEDVSNAIDPETKDLDAADVLTQLASSSDPAQVMLQLDPPGHEFQALKAALARFNEAEQQTPILIPAGRTLKPGMQDSRLALLRQRLKVAEPVLADGEPDSYDDELVSAVMDFQSDAGLSPDGIVGPATLAALNNVGGKISREDIIANMERWRWLPHDLGDFHVLVNIPEFRVAVVQDDRSVFTTRVVVGKPATPTPLFSNSIKNIVVNPYWNVPASIVAKEIAPDMLRDPSYLDRENMEIVSGAHVVDASMIDWSSVTQGNWHYTVRQLPGGGNALGQIKFLFPNAHDVYLHDTPSKSLFGNAVRAYSHGCVRVQNPMDFADALLKYEPGLNASMLETMFGSRERWVNLKTHVPVHIAYFTVRADAEGNLHSYADIYGHNKRLIAMLEGKAGAVVRSATPIVSGV
jgi:murein L,D-transpeptidase YcbB/YkuD